MKSKVSDRQGEKLIFGVDKSHKWGGSKSNMSDVRGWERNLRRVSESGGVL